jgi:hypothetical protein
VIKLTAHSSVHQLEHHKESMKILESLDRTRDETLRHFALGDAELAATYAPGKWPVRLLLHHLADAETVMLERIKRVLSEGHQLLRAFDQDAWAKGLTYSEIPLSLSRDSYTAARAGVRHLANLHYDTKGHLEWVHSETGVRTLKAEFDKVAEHNEHHLRQVRAALGQLSTGSKA